jgi:hypothetical protein
MGLNMQRVQVWTGELPDRPGAAAGMLALLAKAGADLEFIFTQPADGKPGHTALFLAPIQGPSQIAAAESAGLAPARTVAMLCVRGANRLGVGHDIMFRLAVAEINLRSLSISAIGDQFAAYLVLEDLDAVTQAIQVLAGLEDKRLA